MLARDDPAERGSIGYPASTASAGATEVLLVIGQWVRPSITGESLSSASAYFVLDIDFIGKPFQGGEHDPHRRPLPDPSRHRGGVRRIYLPPSPGGSEVSRAQYQVTILDRQGTNGKVGLELYHGANPSALNLHLVALEVTG